MLANIISFIIYQKYLHIDSLHILFQEIFFGFVGSYYVFNLFILWIIFYNISNNEKFIKLMIIISLISNIGTSLNFINPYYNFFNWVIFF